jgi:hypothetical protein
MLQAIRDGFPFKLFHQSIVPWRSPPGITIQEYSSRNATKCLDNAQPELYFLENQSTAQ